MASDAQKRAVKKYCEKFVELHIRVTPEQGTRYKAAAEDEKKSLKQFVVDCIEEHLSSRRK